MKLDTVLQRIPYWYAAELAVRLRSSPGLGKTDTLTAAPALLAARYNKKMGLVVLNGGNLEVMDVQGYLVPKHHDTHTDSLFTRPFWWNTTEGLPLEAYDGGIIVVDEEDKAPVDVKKILGEAALSKRLGGHTLPKGWLVWFAGNRAEDRSGSTKDLDHLINRMMCIDIQPDLDSWTNWANRNHVTPTTIGFAHANPEVVFDSKVPEKQGPWCTPRSLVRADRYLQVHTGGEDDFPTDPLVLEEIGGIMGEGATRQYVNTIRLAQEMPKFEAIIANPGKVKVPEKPDAQMLVCFNLAHRVSGDTAPKVIEYVERFPKEFAVTFARAACNRDAKLVVTPAFSAWCMKNSSLMAIISK